MADWRRNKRSPKNTQISNTTRLRQALLPCLFCGRDHCPLRCSWAWCQWLPGSSSGLYWILFHQFQHFTLPSASLYLPFWLLYIWSLPLVQPLWKRDWEEKICSNTMTNPFQRKNSSCKRILWTSSLQFSLIICSPESLGLVAASVYILSLILFIPFAFTMPIREQANVKTAPEGITVAEFPHYQVCAVFWNWCIELEILLGSYLCTYHLCYPS